MTTNNNEAGWETKLIKSVLNEFMLDADVLPLPGMQPSLKDVYGFLMQVSDMRVKLVISWEAMVSAQNNLAYRRDEFGKLLSQVVAAARKPKGNKKSYVLTTRGLRAEPSETDVETLRIYGGLEEAAKIGEEFVGKMRKGVA